MLFLIDSVWNRLPLFLLDNIWNHLAATSLGSPVDVSAADFIGIDNDLLTNQAMTDKDIVTLILFKNNDVQSEEDKGETTTAEVEKAVEVIYSKKIKQQRKPLLNVIHCNNMQLRMI